MRELKRLGVSIEFEKEHIDTGKLGSEMLLTMLGSAAQEESISISKNLKWSYQKRMCSGEFITCSALLGYFFKDHTLVPNPEEVPIVEYIFHSYLAGKRTKEITCDVNERDIPTIQQKCSQWHHTVIQKILCNQEYVGDTVNFKTYSKSNKLKKRLKNDPGNILIFRDTDEAIIDRKTSELVQKYFAGRKRSDKQGKMDKYSGYPFCGECGSRLYLHRGKTIKPEHNNFQCGGFQRGITDCTTYCISGKMSLDKLPCTI